MCPVSYESTVPGKMVCNLTTGKGLLEVNLACISFVYDMQTGNTWTRTVHKELIRGECKHPLTNWENHLVTDDESEWLQINDFGAWMKQHLQQVNDLQTTVQMQCSQQKLLQKELTCLRNQLNHANKER